MFREETEWDGAKRETTRFQWYKEQEKQKQTLRITKGQEEENHKTGYPDPKGGKVLRKLPTTVRDKVKRIQRQSSLGLTLRMSWAEKQTRYPKSMLRIDAGSSKWWGSKSEVNGKRKKYFIFLTIADKCYVNSKAPTLTGTLSDKRASNASSDCLTMEHYALTCKGLFCWFLCFVLFQFASSKVHQLSPDRKHGLRERQVVYTKGHSRELKKGHKILQRVADEINKVWNLLKHETWI